ncbi:MAG TPA: hypothetical protein VMD78_07760 [Candidatus Baltobacteraceae bacterium]|nr:hypothetical protein [Candidatus Baltobacteraceae bacterium]
MKRLEKQREKAERRAQKKAAEAAGTDSSQQTKHATDYDPWADNPVGPDPERRD